MKIILSILAALFGAIYYLFHKFSFSRPIPDIKKWTIADKIYISLKIIRPVLKAQRNKGIEGFFSSQKLSFAKPQDFTRTACVTLGAGGDIMHSPGFTRESLSKVWGELGPFLFSSDIVFANLETPVDTTKPPVPIVKGDKISDWIIRKAPLLNGSTDTLDSFYDAGGRIDIISTASNHSLNMGVNSLINTLDLLDLRGIVHVGTSRTPREQDIIPIIEKNGIKVAFLAYTFSLNEETLEHDNMHLVNLVFLNEPGADLSLIERHIEIARDKGADIIVASLHWGHDIEAYPVKNIIDRAHELCDMGIDIILGHHPHMLQPMEKYISRGKVKEPERGCFIAYSLSEILSFLFFLPVSWLSGVVKVELEKGSMNGRTATVISDVKFLPFYKLYRRNGDGTEHFHQIDLKRALDNLPGYREKYALSEREIKMMKKLDRLLDNVILPSDSSPVLYKSSHRR